MSYLVSTFISPPWSARPDHPAGGTGGGTGPCAGCSPRPARLPLLGDAPDYHRSTFSAGVKSLLAAGLRRLPSGGGLCRPLSLTGTQSQLKGQPWRERPRDLPASSIMPAATVEVAHATVEWCHRIRRRAQTAPQGTQILMAFGGGSPRFPERLPPWFLDSDSETADAARGAATKSGGWRSSGTLNCQSKPMVDEPVSAKAAVASLSTPTSCKLRNRTPSAAFCAAHERHLAGVTDGAGA